jgi:hypothetical protein
MGWDKFNCLCCFGEWCKYSTNREFWRDNLNFGSGYYFNDEYWCVCLVCKNNLNSLNYYNWEEDFYIENLYIN